MVDDSYILQIK